MASLDSGKLLVAAIDFGTTFSSWAFSFTHDYQCNPTKIFTKSWNSGKGISQKAPTTVLIRPDGNTLEAFGYKAEDMYAELVAGDEHRKWYYFRRFKMALYADRHLNRRTKVEDDMGRKLPAMTVISLVIDYLRKDLIYECSNQISGGVPEDSIHWVLTVPAIWNDKARRFMREAATKAGIPDEQLTIALEPEAASIYCRHIPLQAIISGGKKAIVQLTEGTRYIVIDAGGGTIDITIHEVMDNGNLKELHKATGGAWGGQEVDESFRQFLIKIFGGPVLQQFKKEAMDDYITIFRDFELKKRSVHPDGEGKHVLSLPLTLVEIFEKRTKKKLTDAIAQAPFAPKLELLKGNKLRIDNLVMRGFFDKAVKSAMDHIQTLYNVDDKFGISVALLVGGFSESPMLINALRNMCPLWNVVVPDDAGLVVLKGAVVFGHNPSAITYRICRYTYGISQKVLFRDGVHPEELRCTKSDGTQYCRHTFNTLIEEGRLFKYGDVVFDKIVGPWENEDCFDILICASTDKEAKYTTDDCCTRLGVLRVDHLDMNIPHKKRNCRVIIFFGNTELLVESTDVNTGRRLTASFDILE